MTLRQCIDQKKALYSVIYLKWAMEIAAALVYLTGEDIVHRDLRTDNILVCRFV